jgi:hypothetical protein
VAFDDSFHLRKFTRLSRPVQVEDDVKSLPVTKTGGPEIK